MDLHTPLANLSGVGPILAKRLEKLELHTVEDLITHYPFRYEDFSQITKIDQAKIDNKVTIKGSVWQIKTTYTKFRKIITRAILNDGSGSIILTWFNQPYLAKSIATGDILQVAGTVTNYQGKPSLIAPEWEKVTDRPTIHTGRLVPIYPETVGVSSKWLRNLVNKVLPLKNEDLPDFLPDHIRNTMLTLAQAVNKIHSPDSLTDISQAKHRLGFNELFLIQLHTLQTRYLWKQKTVSSPWKIDTKQLNNFISQLQFELTDAQKNVTDEIINDLQKKQPMNRLVQGEVGSGKTVVAALTIYLGYLNGLQSLFMAPTEILAFQHYETLNKLLTPLGITVGVYTGSKKFTHPVIPRKQSDRNLNKRKIATSSLIVPPRNDEEEIPDVIIGTHALLSDKLKLYKVGLVVIDEQHRFGVEQRTVLRQKGNSPHFLTMTATPIPRTIALTLFGDLDISIINQMPKNRQQIKTYVVPENKRQDAYGFIQKQIANGDQAYIITPLIEESETLVTTKAAKAEYERLKKVFPKLNLGLLHGKMNGREKDQILTDFRDNKIQVLVSTSVVEVGVDVPNATIIVIEGAERFGLAQLHQLRGRVGRGSKQSYCLLFTSNGEAEETNRLKYLEKTFNGLELAELDLQIRGSGSIYGTAQHGKISFQIARLTDLALIEKSRKAAQNILAEDPTLDKYPLIKRKLASISGNVMPD